MAGKNTNHKSGAAPSRDVRSIEASVVGHKREIAFKVRLALMEEISSFMKEHSLSERAVANQAGLTQPRVSNLVNLHYEKFSIDSLVTISHRIGLSTRILIE